MTDPTTEQLRAQLSDETADAGARGFAAAQLGTLRDRASVGALVQCLASTDRGLAESAEQALVDIGGFEVAEALLPLLREDEIGLRNLGIEVLRKMGEDSVASVASLIEDADPDVRLFALEILLEIGIPAVLGPIAGALRDENVNVATAAARALGQLRLPKAVPALLSALGGASWLECAVITALAEIGGEEALAALLAVPDDRAPIVRYTLIGALGTHGSPVAIPRLQAIMEGSPKPLADQAVQAIVRILDDAYESLVEGAVEHVGLDRLIGFLRSESNNTRMAAIRLLGRLDDPGVEEALIELFSQDEAELIEPLTEIFIRRGVRDVRPLIRLLDAPDLSYATRKAGIQLLSESGRREALDCLKAHLKYGEPGLRVDLVRALSTFEHDDAFACVVREAQSHDEFVRCAVADVLDPSRSEAEFDAVVLLFGDDSRSVRQRMIERCRSILSENVKGRLLLALDSARAPVRESVIQTLADRMDAALLARVAAMLPDAEALLFVTAVRCLAANGEAMGDAGRAAVAGYLLARIKDDDPSIRIAVAKGLRTFESENRSTSLLELLEHDPNQRVQYEAALSIQEVLDPGISDRLIALVDDLPPYVQTAVAEVLVRSPDTRASDKGRDVAGRAEFATELLIPLPNEARE